ncbi:MAG: hypothetical protein ACNA7M_12360 [Roseovarius sp.]
MKGIGARVLIGLLAACALWGMSHERAAAQGTHRTERVKGGDVKNVTFSAPGTAEWCWRMTAVAETDWEHIDKTQRPSYPPWVPKDFSTETGYWISTGVTEDSPERHFQVAFSGLMLPQKPQGGRGGAPAFVIEARTDSEYFVLPSYSIACVGQEVVLRAVNEEGEPVMSNWQVAGPQEFSGSNTETITFTPTEPGEYLVKGTRVDSPNLIDIARVTVLSSVDIKRDGNVITDTTTDVMVGEKINLTGEVNSGGLTIASKQWTIPATTVKTYSQTVANGAKTDLAQTDLQQDNISYHWIDGADAREVKYTVVVGGTTCEGKATFNVKRPMSTLTSQTTAEQPPVGVRDEGFGQELIFGSTASAGITWKANVTTPANGAGKIAFVQLINTDMRMTLDDGSKRKSTPAGKYILDPDENGNVRQNGETNIGNSDTINHERADVPSAELETLDAQIQQMFNKELEKFSRNDQFKLFLMYKPNTANSIWVTLRLLQWHWSGSATKNLQTDVWSLDPGAASSQNPGSSDSTVFPEWDDNFGNVGFVPDN